MKVVSQFHDLAGLNIPVVMAMGFFDGVHRGHQAVIQHAVREAHALNGQAWGLTLEPHPLKVLRPDLAPALLTSTDHKLRLFQTLGLAGCVVLPFNQQLAAVEPESFLESIWQAPQIRELVMGHNWSFGHRGRGTPEMARDLAAHRNVRVSIIEPLQFEDLPISSTRIRKAVQAGALQEAEAMLGRPFSLLGPVVKGKQLGRKLGFPTVNVLPQNEVQPPPGVYIAQMDIGRRFNGAAFCPEPQADSKAVEIHVFDFNEELYGREAEVIFLRHLRESRHFGSVDALRNQIAEDVVTIRDFFTRHTALP